MKKLLFLTVVALMPCLGLTQNLTMAELVEMTIPDIGKIGENLFEKGWEIVEFKDSPEEDPYRAVVFAYKPFGGKIEYNENAPRAEAILVVMTTPYDVCGPLLFFHGKEKYLQYIKGIRSLGAKSVSSSVKGGAVVNKYESDRFTFIIHAIEGNKWSISIVPKPQ